MSQTSNISSVQKSAQPDIEDMRKMHVVVVGHVDHGKSTFVGRLVHDTDSLPNGKLEQVRKNCAAEGMEFEYAFLLDALLEEQEQNITIDTTRIFFRINNTFTFVDLPGYGFAKVPLAVKKEWGPMMQTYLSKRENLRGVVLILDIRRIPSEEDLQMLQWLRSCAISPLIVVTKCDKLSKNQRAKQATVIARQIGVDAGELRFFSALSREGLEAVWTRIEDLLGAEQLAKPGSAPS